MTSQLIKIKLHIAGFWLSQRRLWFAYSTIPDPKKQENTWSSVMQSQKVDYKHLHQTQFWMCPKDLILIEMFSIVLFATNALFPLTQISENFKSNAAKYFV